MLGLKSPVGQLVKLNRVPGVRDLASKMKQLQVLFNNCRGERAIANGRWITGKASG